MIQSSDGANTSNIIGVGLDEDASDASDASGPSEPLGGCAAQEEQVVMRRLTVSGRPSYIGAEVDGVIRTDARSWNTISDQRSAKRAPVSVRSRASMNGLADHTTHFALRHIHRDLQCPPSAIRLGVLQRMSILPAKHPTITRQRKQVKRS